MTRVDGAVSGCADSWWSGRRFARAMVMSAVLAMAVNAQAQTTPSVEVYGFGMLDAIIDFNQNNPDWYDVVRPSRLPASENQFGEDGRFYMSARQSRFGVRGDFPTASGPVKTQFEFDMFGVGPDAGLTTIRLRHAWGQWKQIGGGQTNSQFMDIDLFPNTVEYWGPPGMLFLRTAQLFYRPKDGDLRVTVAIEGAGASGDGGVYGDRVEIQGITPRFPLPDFTGEVKASRSWGYLRASGIIGKLSYDDNVPDALDLGGSTTRWGFSVSSNLKPTSNNTLRLGYTYGEGIANYFNDNPIDVGIKTQPGNLVTPVVGDSLPTQGITAFLDHNWNSEWSTAIGYSRVDVWNSDGQAPSAYKNGGYFAANLLRAPVPNVLMGGEFLWGHRANNSDGFSSDDYRLQFSFKYSFSGKIGG